MFWVIALKIFIFFASLLAAALGLVSGLMAPGDAIWVLSSLALSLLFELREEESWQLCWHGAFALFLLYILKVRGVGLFLPLLLFDAARLFYRLRSLQEKRLKERTSLVLSLTSLATLVLILQQSWLLLIFALAAAILGYLIEERQALIVAHRVLRDEEQGKILRLQAEQLSLRQLQAQDRETMRYRERERIARELHDVIGHNLSSAILQLEAEIVTLGPEADPRGLRRIQEQLVTGMEQIRETIHAMREDAFRLSVRVQELAADFPDRRFIIALDAAEDLPLKFRLRLWHTIAESMTNFVKYSEAESLKIQFIAERDFYSLQMADSGPAKSHESRAPGIGLLAMEEFANLYGGKMRVYRDQGFQIFMTFAREAVEQELG